MKLVLENKSVYSGEGFGQVAAIGELVVVNAMVGYQEIITDPDYFGKLVCLSYPLVGNYGITDEDNESKNIQIAGLIVSEYNDRPSNFRFTKTLKEVLVDDDVAMIMNLDTRDLTRHLNHNETMLAAIVSEDTTIDEALAQIEAYKINQRIFKYNEKVYYSRTANFKYTVVAIDLGIKRSLIHALNKLNVNVVVVPYNYSIDKIKALNPDGIVISSGPENKLIMESIKPTLIELWAYKPILAIGTGHLALANSRNLEIMRLSKGHYSCNHPIRDLITNKIHTTVLANQYTVAKDSLEFKKSQSHLLDHTIEGLYNESLAIYSYQGDLAGSNADHLYYFELFIEAMKGSVNNA